MQVIRRDYSSVVEPVGTVFTYTATRDSFGFVVAGLGMLGLGQAPATHAWWGHTRGPVERWAGAFAHGAQRTSIQVAHDGPVRRVSH